MTIEPRLDTRVARAGWDEHWFRGYRVFGELEGQTGIVRLLVLACGLNLSESQARLLDRGAEALTMADPRVPPLLLARIVASEGSAVAGICASWLSCEGGRMGPWVPVRGAQMLAELASDLGDMNLEDPRAQAQIESWLRARYSAKQELPGFGAPFREKDERFEVFANAVRNEGHRGPFWDLARAVDRAAATSLPYPPNIGLLLSGMFLDFGLEGEQISWVMSVLLMHTFVANAYEGARDRAACLRCLPSSAIVYAGADARVSGRAMEAREVVDPTSRGDD